jgi:hypothetical protein
VPPLKQGTFHPCEHIHNAVRQGDVVCGSEFTRLHHLGEQQNLLRVFAGSEKSLDAEHLRREQK